MRTDVSSAITYLKPTNGNVVRGGKPGIRHTIKNTTIKFTALIPNPYSKPIIMFFHSTNFSKKFAYIHICICPITNFGAENIFFRNGPHTVKQVVQLLYPFFFAKYKMYYKIFSETPKLIHIAKILLSLQKEVRKIKENDRKKIASI